MNVALILAGGVGTRIGRNVPKQYIEVKGKPIIAYCVDAFTKHKKIDYIQIVADNEWHEYILNNISEEKFKGFSTPGMTRQTSILSGLQDIKEYLNDNDYVIIHDAARPLVSERLITESLESAQFHDGALPVLSMKDTVYFSEDGSLVSKLLDRRKIFAGQAPETFVFGKYYKANMLLEEKAILNINGSTEPAVMAGMDIAMIPGDENNFKITTVLDLERFKEKIERDVR